MSTENPFGPSAEIPPEGEAKKEFEGGVDVRREGGLVSYDEAFAAARSLHGKVDFNPLNVDDTEPEVQDIVEVIENWRVSANLAARRIGTVEKAQNIVRDANLWLAAGFSGPEIVEDAKERLETEYAEAVREGNSEVTKILNDAILDFEERFLAGEKEQKRKEFQEKLEQGQRLIAAGSFPQAIGMLNSILNDPYLKLHEGVAAEFKEEVEKAEAIACAEYEKVQESKRQIAREKAEKLYQELDGLDFEGVPSIRVGMQKAIDARERRAYPEACMFLVAMQNQARIADRKDLFDKAGEMIDAINQM